VDPDTDDWKTSVSMAYELDIWGKNRRAREAAVAELRGDVERRRSVALTLAGDVTTTYVDYRTLERRRDVALRTLQSRETALALVRDRERAGLGTDLDVARAEAERASAAAAIPELDRQLAISEHRLSILTGAAPGAVKGVLAERAKELEAFPVPVGVPASLLARRPDVRESAERLRAATARIGQAKADLFPQIVLAGEIGLEATEPGKLFQSAAAYWATGPQLKVPLFDAFRRVNSWRAAEERQTEAFYDLSSRVLTAFGEVEDALASVREDARRRDALRTAAESSARATRIATDKFQAGLVAFLDVIEAQRTEFQAEDALAEA
ncbi:MAG TPA: efflux transporter outer membrane subunit, partial [Planctomycetota bacterium]|nr:efflux transporter outer membrane subunit [Planctomycetota bacterium]